MEKSKRPKLSALRNRIPQRRRSKVIVGDPGICPKEYEALSIFLCSLNTEPAQKMWTAPTPLIEKILFDLAEPDSIVARKAKCVWCQFRIYDHAHYWLQPDPTQQAPSRLLGPGCESCLIKTCDKIPEDVQGRSLPVVIYQVHYNKRLADRFIKPRERPAQPFSEKSEPGVQTKMSDAAVRSWGGYRAF